MLEAGEEQLRERALELEGILGREPTVKAVAGDAATAIQREAEDGGDAKLVAVGSRGLGAVRRLALGSVSTDVLRAVDGPVLIAPPVPGEDPPGADRSAGHPEGREREPRDRKAATDVLAPRFR
ncbi:MAG TPA: universal stress protein [Rubrobacter sp.]|nr:universal stress protein [Rubrobacter sp.]